MTSTVAYASASTYYVDNTGTCLDAPAAGTTTQPFCTISYATSRITAQGTTVVVRAGTYAGTAVTPSLSGAAGSPITFTASPGVTISGGTKAFALSGRSYIVISGFTVTGTSSYGISISNGSNDTVSGNTIMGSGSHAIYLSGGSSNTVSGNTESNAGQPVKGLSAYGIWLNNETGDLVQGNVTHDNSAYGIYLSGTTTGALVKGNISYHNAYQWQRLANGINDQAPGNSIIGNLTYANEDSGINIYPGGDNVLVADNVTSGNGDHGIDDYNVTGGGRIIGNTVYGNCTDGINVEGSSGNYTVENNIAVNNATGAQVNPTPIAPGAPANICRERRTGNIGIYDSAPATTTVDYNLVWQSGTATELMWAGVAYSAAGPASAMCTSTGQECHGIVHDPGFVNAAAANFQLTAGSPAIDTANTAVSGQQPADIVGVSPYDDMGAYEYVPSSAGPAAALSVSPASGTAPLAVTADASASTAGSSPISSYAFDFGDGTTAGPQASPTAAHTYSSAGSYTVTVTATDGNNLTSQATKSVTVTAQPPAAKYVNQIATNYSVSSHTAGSVTVYRTAGVAAGDMIIATAQLTGTSTGAVTGTDSKGDTLTVVSDISDGQGNRLVTLAGIAQAGLAVNDMITVKFPTAATYRLITDEVSGVTAADQQSAASGTGSTFSSGTTGTTARSGEFVYATVATFGGTSITWSSPPTALATYTVGSNALGRAYQIPSSTGTVTATGTASGTWLTEVITFK